MTGRGGVAFSAAATADAVRELPGPAAELARRDGQLPVLRLVWPTGADEPPVPDGYATEVRLPLRPGVDAGRAARRGGRGGAGPAARAAGPGGDHGRAPAATCGATSATAPRVRSGDGGRPARVGARIVEVGEPALAARPAEPRTAPRTPPSSSATAGPGRSAGRCRCAPTAGPDPLDGDVLHAPTATAERLGAARPADRGRPARPRPPPRPGRRGDRRRARRGRRRLPRPRGRRRPRRPARAGARRRASRARSSTAGCARCCSTSCATRAWLPGADGTDVAPRAATVLDLPARTSCRRCSPTSCPACSPRPCGVAGCRKATSARHA